MNLDLIEKARKLLDPEPYMADQWEMLNQLLCGETESDREDVLFWVFTKHRGYTYVRMKAGIEFTQRKPEVAWPALEQLIGGPDSDDRDAALSVLAEIKDPRGYPLARPLLNDPYPYLQFDAIDFLQEVYPEEVYAALQGLLENPLEWNRDTARERLEKLRKP